MQSETYPFLYKTENGDHEIGVHNLFRSEDGKQAWKVVKCRVPQNIVRRHMLGKDSFGPPVTGGTISGSGKKNEFTGIEIIKTAECKLFLAKITRRDGYKITTGEMVSFTDGKDFNDFLKKNKLGLVLTEDGVPYLDNEDIAANARLEKSQVAMQLVTALKEAGLGRK